MFEISNIIYLFIYSLDFLIIVYFNNNSKIVIFNTF